MRDNSFLNLNGFEFVLYQDLTETESNLVLDCRNHTNVRKWMFNSDIISKEDHDLFVHSLKSSIQRVYCAVFKNQKLVGCIYYHVIQDGIFYAGHFLNPRIISSGFGIYFEYVYLQYFFEYLKAKEIKAQVKEDNKSMIDIHRLCGFSETRILGEDVINYSLRREEFLRMPKEINNFIRTLIVNYNKNEC